MTNLSDNAVQHYREKTAINLGNVAKAGVRNLGAAGRNIKNWFVPSEAGAAQFGKYFHSNPFKRDVGIHVNPVTKDKTYMHGLFAHNFGIPYGKGAQHDLMTAATKKKEGLLGQLKPEGKRSLRGKAKDVVFGKITPEGIERKFQAEKAYADRMGGATSALGAVKSLYQPGSTLGNVGRFARDNWGTGLAYGFPAMAAYETLKHDDPNRSKLEAFGENLGLTLGGAATLPLGLVGGIAGASMGGEAGAFAGRQLGKVFGGKPQVPPPVPQVQGYNPPVARDPNRNLGLIYGGPY